MSEERKRGWRTWISAFVVLFVLYALSPMPYWATFAWFGRNGYVGEREMKLASSVAKIYWPLQQMIEACPPAQQFYEWYSGFFDTSFTF